MTTKVIVTETMVPQIVIVILMVLLIEAVSCIPRGTPLTPTAVIPPTPVLTKTLVPPTPTQTPVPPMPTQTPVPPTPTSPPPPTPTPGLGSTRVSEKDGIVIVYVPAGEFLMGSADSDEDAVDEEKPQHTVYLDAFWIDQTEVTNAQYNQCVRTGACLSSTCAGDFSLNGDDQPVTCVSWVDARAYCAWVGRRLPTEAEWEKAARGTDNRIYPWGNEPATCDYAVMNDGQTGCGKVSTWPVGSKPEGASPYGALDMGGNAWEWVADWYDANYYASSPVENPPGPSSGQERVLRGGGWLGKPARTRTASRISLAPRDRDNTPDIGFRCAVAALPSSKRMPDWQIVQNDGFDSDTAHWDRRLGKLGRTTAEFNTAPGAAYAITNHPDGAGGYTAVFGQCINLGGVLDNWPVEDGQKNFTLEATMKTDMNIMSVSITGLFFQDARCSNPPSGMSDVFPPPVPGNQDWTRVSATVTLPDSARSIDVFFHVTGKDNSGTVYIDDVRAYPSDPNTI